MSRFIVFIVSTLCCVHFNTFSQANYFQQKVDYKIIVKLDDKKHMLYASLSFDYTNNSTSTLDTIWMHLWPNAYEGAGSALNQQKLESGDYGLHFGVDSTLGFIDSLDFKQKGQKIKWNFHPDHRDVAYLVLNNPLSPGSSTMISTPFRVKLPSGQYSRLGHIGQSYQITQWYPKPAVFDRDGWHYMPYLDQGEFYSEFGSFDVSISLPKNYVLGATGDLQNDEERVWLLDKVRETEELLEKGGLKPKKISTKFPKSSEEYKTLRFVQSRVHDFAWFADKRYMVLMDTVLLPHSGRPVECWAMFTGGEAHLWAKATEYIKDGTYYYSLWNGDYPYNHVTAVDGTISAGGGMEYPNITVIGRSGSPLGLETVIVHEVGHNWFYGILGSNERIHAWMDEGLNTLNENRYLETKYPERSLIDEFIPLKEKTKKKLGLDILKSKSQYEYAYLLNARRNYDQPIELPSDDYTGLNYGAIVYSKTGIVFDYLKAFLGESVFDSCMHEYYRQWSFRHPSPVDLRNIFENTSGKDLSWFFEDVITTTKKIDHKIVSAKSTEWVDYGVKVKQIGEIDAPFSIGGVKGDSVYTIQWYDGIPESGEVTFPKGDYDKLVLDPTWDTPELTRTNNVLKVKGLVKKFEPLKIQMLGGIEHPYKTMLYYLPVVGWNRYDGVMAGMAFYNSLFPRKRFDFSIAPMYGFNSGDLAGLGELGYNIRQSSTSIFQNVRFELKSRRFHQGVNVFTGNDEELSYYNVARTGLNFEFKRKSLKRSPINMLAMRYSLIDNEIGRSESHYDLNHTFTRKRPFHLLSIESMLRYSSSTLRDGLLGSFTVSNEWRYDKSGHKVKLRGFVGGYLYEGRNGIKPNWAITLGGQSGVYDYTYDRLFLGRTEQHPDLLAQRMVFNQGGFKAFTPIVSDRWLSSLSLDVDLPLPIRLGVFADVGYFPVGNVVPENGTIILVYQPETAYDFGVRISMIRGLLDVYIPLGYSDLIGDYYDLIGYNFWQRIRFDLRLSSVNPLKIIDNLGQ